MNKRIIKILFVGVDCSYHTNTEKLHQTELLTLASCPIPLKQTSTSLQDFAQELIAMNVKEINELAQILRDEYGIYPQSNSITEKNLFFNMLPDNEYQFIFKHTKKQKNYVPKTIGMINNKPKISFKMRRNLFY